ncbi:alpha/beta fold hydrolase [Sunxiuqinia elliptica]|uniref:Pimeloyl-ACP methyl ester carboxylesterase n=1 Tax=Sunxiuqinia elliptica TaxID=655355 RepID=A0A1I2F3J5_9BACT|nr:alpha/beta hydrolase [Sunxiuqinia elliptica]SFE99070.1 Pimeloyl-ACP methyl ester carboxylesterase [Sunxiuqinia elliptica]
MKSIRKYGSKPYRIALLHGGPGAAGELKPVAENLAHEFGVLELLQSERSVSTQLLELHKQLSRQADLPVSLIGHSWGAWLAFLFAANYPDLVRQLILIGSGAFDEKYNKNLIDIRLSRLSQANREEAEYLLCKIHSGNTDNQTLRDFGRLMNLADSFDYEGNSQEQIELDMEIYQSVWPEASKLRATKKLLHRAANISCPVVAIHGSYDPHPIDGVEQPLAALLPDFKMIRLNKCGHTPWFEKQASVQFFEILREELRKIDYL